jgi:uncharacterized protein (TIGR03382 family)
VTEAPPGGLWWIDLQGAAVDVGDVLHLGIDDRRVDVDVAIVGMRLVGLRVAADAVVGTRVPLVDEEHGIEARERDLVVSDSAPVDVDGDLAAPDLVVEDREVRGGYESVVVVPFVDVPCGFVPGLWNMTYRQSPFVVVDVPDGQVVEVSVRLLGDFAFDEFRSANEMLVPAGTGHVEEQLRSPPPATTSFAAHARFVRLADGAIGPVTSIDVEDPEDDEVRLEWVGCGGCSAGGGAEAPLLGVLLLLLRRRRR